jgi:hypothetical protein
MKVRFNNILALLMVLAFLSPSIVKLEHHHDHFVCKAKNEKHFHNHHEKCYVCSFEFSFFSLNNKAPIASKSIFLGDFVSHYKQSFFSDNSKYSFLLRAPPVPAYSI